MQYSVEMFIANTRESSKLYTAFKFAFKFINP